jgi:hypothetical protein
LDERAETPRVLHHKDTRDPIGDLVGLGELEDLELGIPGECRPGPTPRGVTNRDSRWDSPSIQLAGDRDDFREVVVGCWDEEHRVCRSLNGQPRQSGWSPRSSCLVGDDHLQNANSRIELGTFSPWRCPRSAEHDEQNADQGQQTSHHRSQLVPEAGEEPSSYGSGE